MKLSELKIGLKVFDTWFADWGVGVVDKVLKTRVFIKFPYPKGMMKYDVAHIRFLAEATR